ncbi:hypothetical protein [Bradyrhizobium sp. F1.13.3]|uniref:hypothetical protein n=1 Tax=Bradyrhizobium sp. F1.13.3 TaxID=3156351 RepID=UPI003392BD0E
MSGGRVLDVDSAVLDRLYAGGELEQLAGCRFWIGKMALGDVLHRWNQNLKGPCLA